MNSSDSKYRIAVCFSGQLRFWKQGASNIKRFFTFKHPHPVTGQDIETDYFVHTWDTNTWRLPKTEHGIFHEEKHNDIGEFVAEYEPKAWAMDKWVPEKYPLAWDPMFYSFEHSVLLKKDYELRNDFRYDLVVKARPDVIYNPNYKFPLNRIWPGVCYTATPISKFTSEFNYNCLDDVLFYGDSPSMDLMSDLYSVYKTQYSDDYRHRRENDINLDPMTFIGPGTMLYKHAVNVNIHPDCINPIEYAVLRSTSVNKKLDPIADYEEYRKLWFEWYI